MLPWRVGARVGGGTGDFVGLIGTGVRRLQVSRALVDVLVDPGDSNGTRWEVLKSG
jgi:hypothetical protein